MCKLEITNDIKIRVKGLIKFAYSNEVSINEMIRIMTFKEPPKGDDPNFNIDLGNGIRVVFTIEEHPKFVARHISISCKEKIPNHELISEVINLFDFRNELSQCFMYPEKNAINILEPL